MLGKYKESSENRNQIFEKRKQEMIEKARSTNNETIMKNIEKRQ